MMKDFVSIGRNVGRTETLYVCSPYHQDITNSEISLVLEDKNNQSGRTNFRKATRNQLSA